MDINRNLFQKYDKPVPRYTSYPSYPYWKKSFQSDEWRYLVSNNGDIKTNNKYSIYIHFPYCEKLCFFCGCNKVITKNHALEIPYIEALLKEWEKYVSYLPEKFEIKELHLGGGTPTFFSAKNLKYFFDKFFSFGNISDNHDFSIEAHPGVTTKEHLDILSAYKFNRLSLGVQDFNLKVQKAIGRHQTVEDVIFCTNYAKSSGFSSVNFDLIYGLPHQNIQSIEETFEKVIQIKPDRIAFYGYAHLPDTKPSQKKLELNELPSGQEKYSIYQKGHQLLLKNGYKDLGYDHFALESDSMYKAFLNGNLNRNFMGYTIQNTPILLGLGVSAISDFGSFYVQNKKSLNEYLENISNGLLDFQTGYVLTEQDKIIKKHIQNLSCYRKTSFKDLPLGNELEKTILNNLSDFIKDELVSVKNGNIQALPKGIPFLRNICSCFDMHILNSKNSMTHSKSI